MKISVHRYQLKPRASLSSRAGAKERQGALIRVESQAGMGFADIHPWTELGDESLEKQVALLAEGQLTPLTRQSLYFAKKDAEARARGVSLFAGLEIPESHFLLTDLSEFNDKLAQEIGDSGFSRVKLKVGRDAKSELAGLARLCAVLNERVKFRLDFNVALDLAGVQAWLADAARRGCVERLDFIEDPWVWNPQAWAELKSRFGVRLAGDRETQSLGASELEDAMKSGVVDLQVLKPAVQEWPGTKRRVVFTSYLDHPLGQMSAAYVAANTVADQNISAGVEVCGLLSHRAYEANPFSELLCVKGAFLKPAGGTGLGFDELLAKLSWEKLGALRS